ncbi:MAG: PHP domain-containing protein [Lachnospiraceae bacterium]|nr:PHP domain-containing protein [Lachnospiraceae bacterium]
MKIEHDFHIHTNLSLCAKPTATPEYYLKTAQRLGLKKIGFSDHFWDSAFEAPNEFYRKQDYAHVSMLKTELERVQKDGVRVFWGCEAEYDPVHHGVGITEETAEKFDFILVPNSHTHMMMPKECYEPYQKHVDFMIQAYEEIINSNVSRYITAIAHPFDAVCCPHDKSVLYEMISDDCFKRLFDRTAEKEIAVEINLACVSKNTKEQIESWKALRMFRLAKECGCKFIFGSDAHSDQDHASFANAELIAGILELKENDIARIACT